MVCIPFLFAKVKCGGARFTPNSRRTLLSMSYSSILSNEYD